MATSQAIHEHASDHTRLLNALAELDYVPSAFAQQTGYLNDLNTRVKESEKKIEALSKKTKKERKEHEALRTSTVRRLAHKLTGQGEKFAAKASKEEREFVEAMEKELVEKDQLEVIRQMRDEASHVYDDLSSKATRYESLKAELDTLYHRIFDGPTAEFPQDDQLERDVQANQAFHDEVQKAVNAESRAADLLAQAERYLHACARNVNEALQASQWDIYGARGADYFERNALSNAQSLALQVETLVHQAQSISPFVEPIGNLNIAQGSWMSDVFFDNIFTDMAFHRKIQETSDNVRHALNKLKAQHQAACQRANTAGAQLSEASQNLNNARMALFNFRQETFQAVAIGDRPPDYGHEAPRQYPAPAGPPPGFPVAIPTTAEPEEIQPTQQEAAPDNAKPKPQPGPAWGTNNPYAAFLMRRASTPADALPKPPAQTQDQAS